MSGEGFGIVDAEDAEGILAGLKIGLSLRAVGFGGLEVGQGDGAVIEKILRASEKLIGKEIGIARLDVGGARSGVIGAVDGEERLPLMHGLAGATRSSWTGPPIAAKTGVVMKAL